MKKRKMLEVTYFRKVFLFITFTFFVSTACISPEFNSGKQSLTKTEPTITNNENEAIYVSSVKNKVKDELINEVGNYIYKVAPESKLQPAYLVDVCEKYDLDIVFVMAQAMLESHFGTRGKAAYTNSVWNVGTYDNGVIVYRYSDPNESIEPYAKLLYENYLLLGDSCVINDRDVYHLAQDRGYKNYNGKRFATAKGYENALRKIMLMIDANTSIKMLQGLNEMPDSLMLAFFNPNYDKLCTLN